MYNSLGRHLIAITKSDDGMQFFREHALKSVWKPIIAFRNDANNEHLDYKTVKIHPFITSKIYLYIKILVFVIASNITSGSTYSHARTD
jgi:hypothetical protein